MSPPRWWIAAILFGLCARAAEVPSLRLDPTSRPVRYAADLTIVPDRDTFQGSIDIQVRFSKPQSVLWLNTTALSVSETFLLTAQARTPVRVVRGNDQVTGFDFGRPVSGDATLHIAYTGTIGRNTGIGVFQARLGDAWYVYTYAEPTSARRIFPCFDDPRYKTPWQLTLRVPAGSFAFSNYPVTAEQAGRSGLKTVRFMETRPLPSYLISFAVGPFEAVDAGKVGQTRLRVLVPRGRAADARFAAESIPHLLRVLEQYFGIPYPFPKLDSVATPLGGGAMENAGLITYDVEILLSGATTETPQRQRYAAYNMAHEMSHQWFGDLVTMNWWNDLWLNEAFATWMGRRAAGEWKPEWRMDADAVADRVEAMKLDSLISARRIRQNIQSYDDINSAFDGITYNKGAAVINMFEGWIGADTFREGVRQYLRSHTDGNATTADFTAAETQAFGRDVSSPFNSFLDQAGVPLVAIAQDCSGPKTALDLTQKRSLPIGSPGALPQTWQVPVCVRSSSGAQSARECFVLGQAHAKKSLSGAHGCPAWVLGNDTGRGYYRVAYEADLLPKLLAGGGGQLSATERVAVLADVAAEVRTGAVSPEAALGLVPEFASDGDRHVVESTLEIAGLLESPRVSFSLRPKAEEFIRRCFGARAEKLGWRPKPDETNNEQLLRASLVATVASAGNERALVDQASELAWKWLSDHRAVNSTALSGVLDTAAQFGRLDLFERLRAAAKAETDLQVRRTLFEAMGLFRDPAVVQQGFQILLSDEFPAEDVVFPLLVGPTSWPPNSRMAFDFARAHYDALAARLPVIGPFDYGAWLPYVGRSFCDAGTRDQFQTFFAERMKKRAGGTRNLAQMVEQINMCIAQKQALGPKLEAFLEQ